MKEPVIFNKRQAIKHHLNSIKGEIEAEGLSQGLKSMISKREKLMNAYGDGVVVTKLMQLERMFSAQ